MIFESYVRGNLEYKANTAFNKGCIFSIRGVVGAVMGRKKAFIFSYARYEDTIKSMIQLYLPLPAVAHSLAFTYTVVTWMETGLCEHASSRSFPLPWSQELVFRGVALR
jgi:hypothetical protein